MRSTTPDPTIWGATTLMSPTTLSAMFAARLTSTWSVGSYPLLRAFFAISCSFRDISLRLSKYLFMRSLACGFIFCSSAILFCWLIFIVLRFVVILPLPVGVLCWSAVVLLGSVVLLRSVVCFLLSCLCLRRRNGTS